MCFKMYFIALYPTESKSVLHSEQDKQVNIPVILNTHYDVSLAIKRLFLESELSVEAVI